MIVYCVTAEVRSRRSKFQHIRNKTEVVEQMIIDDFGKEDCRWVEPLLIN